jgi:hypothetical protein
MDAVGEWITVVLQAWQLQHARGSYDELRDATVDLAGKTSSAVVLLQARVQRLEQMLKEQDGATWRGRQVLE